MANVVEICEMIRKGEIVAIPTAYVGIFIGEVHRHNIVDVRLKFCMQGDKTLIGRTDFETVDCG